MEEVSVSTETNSGVESAQVADVQTNETAVTTDTPDVASQGNEGKDFSTALKAREVQIRQQIEQEYSTKMQESQTKLSYMEKQAKIYGYETVEEYTQALDDYERQQEVQNEAKKYGVPEDFIRGELKPLKDELQQLKQEREQFQTKEQERQLQSELEKIRADNPDFDQYFDSVKELYQKGYSLNHAYRLASYEDKIAKIGQEKEQEVLANVTKRASNQVLPSTDKPNNLAFNPANMSTADIMDISRRVQAGEKIKF
jgi:hypothetical protein